MSEQLKCPECGKEFIQRTVIQKYCSIQCGQKYRSKHKVTFTYPSITFTCSNCGRIVVTEGSSRDKRSRFCCMKCEKKFWRRPHWENPATRINFHSIEEYKNYEERTNQV